MRLSLGRVMEVDLETHSMADTFSALGRLDEAERARDVLGSPAVTAAVSLAPLLLDLFRVPPPVPEP